jgi:hypothetical protein
VAEVSHEQLTLPLDLRYRVESDLPAARLLRRLVAGGMPMELVPQAAALVAELERLAIEERAREEAAGGRRPTPTPSLGCFKTSRSRSRAKLRSR